MSSNKKINKINNSIPNNKNKIGIFLDKIKNIYSKKYQISAIYKFNLANWLKSPGSIFSLLFPLILLFIIGNIGPIKFIGPGIISSTIFANSLFLFGATLVETKNSSLMKRIGSTPIKMPTYILGLVLFSMSVILMSVLWLVFWIFLANRFGWVRTDGVRPGEDGSINWSIINYGGVTISIIFNLCVSILFTIFVAAITKTYQGYSAMISVYFFLSVLLGGMLAEKNLIEGNQALNWISRFLPHRYINFLMVDSFVGNDVFNFNFQLNHQKALNNVLNLTIPPAVIVLLFYGAVKNFKWDNTR